jgi:hypothetical protein
MAPNAYAIADDDGLVVSFGYLTAPEAEAALRGWTRQRGCLAPRVVSVRCYVDYRGRIDRFAVLTASVDAPV